MIKEGIINLLKPAGMTSHDGVQFLRRLTGIKRIGHTGTLDPMAVGVLPLCIGSAARITEYLDLDYKKYRCEMQLGIETDTQDIWGTILQRNSFHTIQEKDVKEVLRSFEGHIMQTPPSYSAVRVDGRRLYEYAREGQTVHVKSRPVHLKKIELIHFDSQSGTVTYDVECSKGTYVRTICQEAGDKLGCKAAMSCLIRTASGRFKIEDTVTIEELQALRIGEDKRDPNTGRYIDFARVAEGSLDQYTLSPDYPLVHFGKGYVNQELGKWFVNGGHLSLSEVKIAWEPEFKDASEMQNIREEYQNAYNIYLKDQNLQDVFLGVAFYNKQYKKLVADKIFLRISDIIG